MKIIKIKERNEQMQLEVKNYLIKMISLNLNCFKISYTAAHGGLNEQTLDEARVKTKTLLTNFFENVEFVFIVNEPTRRSKTNLIVCFRPILSALLNENSIYAALNEYHMLYDNFNILPLKSVKDVDVAVKTIRFSKTYSTHTFISFSRFFEKEQASLTDFLMGNYEKEKDQSLIEINDYSNVKGNCTNQFDVYSIVYLVELFLIEKKMGIRDNYIYYKENNEKFISLEELYSTYLIKFLNDKFFYQINLIDLTMLIVRNKRGASNLLKEKYG